MSVWVPVLGLRPWPVVIPLPVATDAARAEAVAWLRGRVVGVAELAGLAASKEPRLYGNVEAERVWLGVWLPGRLRARQSLFRGALDSGADGWQLKGSMRASLNDQIRDVRIGADGTASVADSRGSGAAASAFASVPTTSGESASLSGGSWVGSSWP